MTRHSRLFIVPALLMLAACDNPETTGSTDSSTDSMNGSVTETRTDEPETASAILTNRQDEQVGTIELTETFGAVHLDVEITGFPPGEYGFHIHETGRCEGPDFESAGGHFNPTNEEHGVDEPEGSHVGDMTNLVVSPEGRAETSREVDGATLGDGTRSLLRAGGTAIVIHQRPDDYETDPSGAAGPRLACGVIEAG